MGISIDPIQLLQDLVRINSVNAFYPEGPGEAAVADFVEAFWKSHGIKTWRQSVLPGRDNVIAELPGISVERRLLLEAHTDTVSVSGMTIRPFEPMIRDGKLFGRGSCDTKAGLACMMAAVAWAKQQGIQPKSSIWMASVIDEEFSCKGVLALCETLRATAAIVAEPTELTTVIASKGVLRWRITAKGKQAHSSKVHLGVNAIEHMAHLIAALENYHRSLASITHPLLGCATGNIGLIEGGVQVNFVPDHCSIQIDRRLLPQEKVDQVLAGYQRVLDEVASRVPNSNFQMETPMLYDAGLETPSDASIAQLSCSVLKEMGYDDRVEGVAYGSDGTHIRALGIETIIFGPGSIDQAHTECEFVDVCQVQAAYEYYKRMIQEF
jgi:acetylornithine deacetylase